MLRGLLLSVALLAGLAQLVQAADPPAVPPADAGKPLPAPEADLVQKAIGDRVRAVRTVRDLATFNILNLSSQEDGAWMVAGICPGGLSGSVHNQGWYIEAETGNVVDRGIRPALVNQFGGQWKRIELLSGEAPPEGRYQWQEPHQYDFGRDRSKSICDYGSVFAGPDVVVICRFFEKQEGAAQFALVTAIPDDWKTFVKPAYEYHVQHGADFTDGDLNGLRKMATGENPFIALTAIRHLLSRTTTAEEMDPLVDLARSLPTFRQAVLTHWLLKRNDDHGRATVLKAVSSSKSASELPGIALGIESWTASQPRNGGIYELIKNLREPVTEKWHSFDRSTTASWEKILIAQGTPEGNSTQTNESEGAKQESKSSAMKERFRFEFWKVGAFQQRLVIQDLVTVDEPFDIRAKDGATATGVLRRSAEGGLHFKGEVSHAGMSAVFDSPDDRLKGGFVASTTKGGPDSGGFQWIDVYFSLSHVEENVPAGLGLGVSGKQDQVIVVPGPKAEGQRPSVWFDSRLKADNILTTDQETWVLFRSKQLNATRMWIDRIERDENTFTVTMNGPEATAGDDHYEVHGINLGKLPTGNYEVKWIIRGRPTKDDKPAESVELKSSFKLLER